MDTTPRQEWPIYDHDVPQNDPIIASHNIPEKSRSFQKELEASASKVLYDGSEDEIKKSYSMPFWQIGNLNFKKTPNSVFF
jgi:hypothetical protein